MPLLDLICGRKYRNNYIRSYKDLVEDYDENNPRNKDKCLNIMLQTNYKTLVDQRLIPKNNAAPDPMSWHACAPIMGWMPWLIF